MHESYANCMENGMNMIRFDAFCTETISELKNIAVHAIL